MNNLKSAIDFFDKVVQCTPRERIAIGTDHYTNLLFETRKCEKDFETMVSYLITGTGDLYPPEVQDFAKRLLNDIQISEDDPRWGLHE